MPRAPGPAPAHALPSALHELDGILAASSGRQLALFLDYDGTLTPIVDRPELARLSEGMRETLQRLADRTLVALVSGRDIDDLRRLAPIEGAAFAGSHGFQLRDREGREEVIEAAAEYRADLQRAGDALLAAVGDLPGAILERKGFAVAVHYRQVVPDRKHEVRPAVEAVAAREPRLRVTGGKQVVELRPAFAWDKGRAVSMLVERWGGDDLFPIYIGDDETDEDAFRALRAHGTGIVVGDVGATYASHRLEDVAEVHLWLERLSARLDAPGGAEG